MDWIDRSVAEQEADLERAIAAARGSLDREAGAEFCEDCGAVIPPPRRVAYPTATRCVECQSAHEHRLRGRAHG